MQYLKWPLKIQWRKAKDIPLPPMYWANAVILNGMVYCGGDNSTSFTPVQYNPESGEWSVLPSAPKRGFSMTSLNGLVLVGGDDNKITVWDSGRNEWVYPYPAMPTERSQSAAVGYQNYLIVACGVPRRDTVDVLDSSSGRWYSAQPVPVGGHLMSSVVVGDHWYLSSFFNWSDRKEHIFWAHLPTLISSATSVHANTTSIWHELPTPPVEGPTLLALHGHLLLVGGVENIEKLHHYDPETRQWRECGQLPVGLYATCCTVLPSGELMVAGGATVFRGALSPLEQCWIGNIE